MEYEKRARDAGIDLDMELAAIGTYVFAVPVGNILFVAGSIAWDGDKPAFPGRLGVDLDVAAGQQSARGAGGTILASVHQTIGGLDKVVRVVRLTGYVKSGPEFGDQPKVINGASDLMVEVFGDAGHHARSAIGVAELPLGASVEVEGIFEIDG
jgi:enamine deaminase RidA (YjgF/YER057c/UK114 family)